jgi:RNA polymerase sigma-70 factor (ECF subfamily)
MGKRGNLVPPQAPATREQPFPAVAPLVERDETPAVIAIDPSDAALDRESVQAFLQRREEAAFRVLYRRHSPRLLPLIRRLLGRAHRLAEDVLQETWVRAVRDLPGFRWESSLGWWLRGIAVNRCREVLRREGREGPLEEDEAALPGGTPTPAARIDLERAIGGLADGHRTVLLLHDVEGWTHVEIARLLGIDTGTSKSQLHRARRAVRERLHPAGENRDERSA